MRTPPRNQNESRSEGCGWFFAEKCSERKMEECMCGSLIREPICHTTTTI